MQKHTYTRYTNKSGKFEPETVTITEYTFEELCFDEQREVAWPLLPRGTDIRYSIANKGVRWRRIRDAAN